jgi:2-polyprenyl-6-methoxyphenol hydroxylase-like FAD-dependent oxidoreductase
MAQLGHQVHLIERQQFPRTHLGESLSPGVMPMLRAADMHETIEAARFPSVTGVQVKWEGEARLRDNSGEPGLLVDRGEFDRRLVERAGEFGVQLHQPAQVLEQTFNGAKWRLTVDADGVALPITADFLADASGRRSAARRHAIKTGASTLAVYGYWRGTTLPTIPRIEAGEDGWYWGVPLPDGSYNTLVFVDPGWFRTAPGETMSERFVRLLDRSALMHDCGDAELITPVQAIDATSYLSDVRIGPSRIQLGDAALAIDPISSSGVQKAIQTALSGAVVANTLLRRPEAADTAIRFYRAQLEDASERHRRWAAGHYSEVAASRDRPFWRARAGEPMIEPPSPPAINARGLATMPVELSRELEFVSTPCLQGDFVSLASALHHPRLTAPLVFLGGRELAPLLRALPPGKTPLQIAQSWSNRMPLESGMAIAGWLVSHGILVEQHAQGGTRS